MAAGDLSSKEGGLYYRGRAIFEFLSEMEQTWHTSSDRWQWGTEMKEKFKIFENKMLYSYKNKYKVYS
jgi:hypothetical protein